VRRGSIFHRKRLGHGFRFEVINLGIDRRCCWNDPVPARMDTGATRSQPNAEDSHSLPCHGEIYRRWADYRVDCILVPGGLHVFIEVSALRVDPLLDDPQGVD
jgi:hypothetical protein